MATKKITLNELKSLVKKVLMEFDERPAVDNDYIEIEVHPNSKDFKILESIVNQGIDPHLEGFTKSKFGYRDYESIGKRAFFNFHKSEKGILLRRLEELFEKTGDEDIFSLIDDIKNYDNYDND